MIRTRRPLLAFLLAAVALPAPAAAASDGMAGARDTVRDGATRTSSGALRPAERQAYAAVFDAMRAGDWAAARAGIAANPDSVLAPVAEAELMLAKNSPRVERDAILSLVARAPELPQAPQLLALAKKRGATELPTLPAPRDLDWVNGAPTRVAARAQADDVAAAALAQQARPLLKSDQPAAAEALLTGADTSLAPESRTEWQQRVAWSYYLNGDDANARRLADSAARGPGEWATQASWVAGLSAWRTHDCKTAEDAFSRVAANAGDDEMKAAGLFWTARSEMACGRFDRVQGRLRQAARVPETFYGLISARMLGTQPRAGDARAALTSDEWNRLSPHPDIRRAAALVEVGEYGLADEMLRWQAKIGDDGEHRALLHLAAQLDLPATQVWLAHNCPAGEVVEASARYPRPSWIPQGGWQVDKALVFAHALQESRFRTDAQSKAGAYGLLQVLPGTADLIERKRGGQPVAAGSLVVPAVNMAYGQAYLERLRDTAGTGGLLPKVIAAYNAGPGAVARWNINNRAENDPLLYIESIPYAETRGYVTMVLRNYWMYQGQAGELRPSLTALAQGQWPRFPGAGGATGARTAALQGVTSAN
ncbi:lytic transglycosylase domain-containing protein [Sphingomonas sp.]|uniref:lytic transglycosylase domain-containing protein n=1 Tax=Sphingomonas sp. TaxID=28214 RepID=UPI003B00BDDE